MNIKIQELLEVSNHYSGEGISVRRLEETIHIERDRQNEQVDRLNKMRSRNDELQSALSTEVDKLRQISQDLSSHRGQSAWQGFLSKLPFFKDKQHSRKSIEELLRRQYEISAIRVKEAAEFADRLDAAKADLYDEIERLNGKIIQYAQNEKDAAATVLTLSDAKTEFEGKIALAEPGSLEVREMQAQLDKVRRALGEHSAMLKLFSTAEDRLVRLQENTRMLSQTISQLQSDIALYVTVAGEKLDLIAGQIQAIGAAADASMVMLELKQSLEAMTESVNHTTRFVSETQAYFRSNVDQMVDELELYDTETETVLQGNLAMNEVYDDMQIAEAISLALERQIEEAASESDAQYIEE
ncbi:unnamed protein product, partial [Laminaria digitata]